MTQRQPPAEQRSTRLPSPVFLGLVAVALLSGVALYNDIGAQGIFAFLFVLSGWVVTLCLHEFAHALVAFRTGDRDVEHRGYLTLNPLKYTHIVFSIVLPIVFLVAGGIGLPGGAVFINRHALRSRGAMSAVSASGPLTNLAIAIVLALVLAGSDGRNPFWAALAFLLFLQVTAAVLNLIPIPGLDGYGVIEPWVPPSWQKQAQAIAPFAVLGLFALLWVPAVNAAFFGFIDGIVGLLGVTGLQVSRGYFLFQFWR